MIWNDIRMLGMLANALFTLAVCGFVASGLVWVAQRPYFDFKVVQIGAMPGSALRHVPVQTLAERIRETRVGSFFTIDMDAFAEAVESVPWVRRAAVRRVWPDTLQVELEEHMPHAIWEDGRLINNYGELFDANLDEAVADGSLPQLSGPSADTALQVVRRYDELVVLTRALGMVPVSVSLSDRRAWRATMEDGTELVIGREHQGAPVTDRIRRWAEVFPLVTERVQRRAAVIDLRYESGFAVRSLEPLAEAFDIEDLIDQSLRRDQRRDAGDAAEATTDPLAAEMARVFTPAARQADQQGALPRAVPAETSIKP
jgi:cell division protein FtsQ